MQITTKSWLALAAAASLVTKVDADVPMLTAKDADAFNAGLYGLTPNQTYHSSNLIGPRYLVSKFDKAAASHTGSHFFLCPQTAGQPQGPMILSASDLSLVYTDPSWSGGADTRVQLYQDQHPYLTFWSGNSGRGGGSGGGVLVDTSYNEFLNITTSGLTNRADSHEFQLTPDGTGALFINARTATADCTSAGGPNNCTIRAWTFQEVDIATGKPVFTWSAEDHFPFSDSLSPYSADAQQWDWFHMNSLAKTSSGNYVLSARYLSAVILIDGNTGETIWQVGGKSSDFSFETPEAEFRFQHDARLVEGLEEDDGLGPFDDLTLFDNHVLLGQSAVSSSSYSTNLTTPGCTGITCSRGLRIRLNHRTKTASLVNELPHPAGVETFAEGSYQVLKQKQSGKVGGDGHDNVLVAYGTAPAFVEFAMTGRDPVPVLEVQAAPWAVASTGAVSLYRVYKMDWVATPDTKPDVALVKGEDGKTTVYVSWNGATEVASWVLFGRHGRLPRTEIAKVPRQGFESAFQVDSLPSWVQVEARDLHGKLLGATEWLETE